MTAQRNIQCVGLRRVCAVLVFASVLASCAGTQPSPPGMLGYGTPGVESNMPQDKAPTLQALLDRCRDVPQATADAQTSGLPSACSQLKRTSHNQPGNAVR